MRYQAALRSERSASLGSADIESKGVRRKIDNLPQVNAPCPRTVRVQTFEVLEKPGVLP
ncbi:protein of unknown function [Nitratireductor aquimarinus]